MGCGESKHAVATANTINQTKRSSSKKTKVAENETSIEKVTDDVKSNPNVSLKEQAKGENVIGKEGENVSKVSEDVNGKESQNPKEDNGKQRDDHQENVASVAETAKEEEIKEAAIVPDVTEEASEKKEFKEEITEESAKTEESKIESVIPDGVSENAADVPKEKESTAEEKKEEAVEGNEGTQTKEGEAALEATVVTEDSAKTGEEKAPAAKEEIETVSSAEDPNKK